MGHVVGPSSIEADLCRGNSSNSMKKRILVDPLSTIERSCLLRAALTPIKKYLEVSNQRVSIGHLNNNTSSCLLMILLLKI